MTEILGYTPEKNEIYLKALQHKSGNTKENNERLEFLGDAILTFIIAKQLYIDNPKKEEGFLSKKRAAIVSRRHLNMIGKTFFSDQNIKTNLKNISKNIYGNTLESLIAAIYIDKGILEAEKFIVKNIYKTSFSKTIFDIDYKSKLLNKSQQLKTKVEYKVLSKKGPDHKQEFLVGVFINNLKKAEAKGFSIKQAEQRAAKKTYNNLFSKQ